ncbi:unannotated protein [freshwater metagenome]|uniref:Unannotated protein n=1 Tax=freshwater metagenome TaxID=449393 RepID=A0A6J6H0B2_9ZZZZ
MVFPGAVPETLQVPAATIVIEVPLTVHTPVVRDETVTLPAVADAVTVNGDDPNRFEGISLKTMGLVVAVYVIEVVTESVPAAPPRMT